MNISNEEMVVRYVERFQSTVVSGGFEGFFRSEFGDYAQETLNALLILGALDAAALLRGAMFVFDTGEPPREPKARRVKLRQVGEAGRSLLRGLDESFRGVNEGLTNSLAEYSQSLEGSCVVT